MSELFEQFLKERQYLKNVTPRTLGYYRKCFKAFRSVVRCDVGGLTRRTLQDFTVTLRDRHVSPITCNSYAPSVDTQDRQLIDTSKPAIN